jgi:hypothetical protein
VSSLRDLKRELARVTKERDAFKAALREHAELRLRLLSASPDEWERRLGLAERYSAAHRRLIELGCGARDE